MRLYEVQAGESPASIAARPDMAGCPKCARDLILANPHKEAVEHPNGFVTFKDLRAGETLILPDKWFDGTLDRRPSAYFAALPYSDGTTSSTLGLAAAGILGDYATFDTATSKVNALSTMSDQAFNAAVSDVAATIDQSVREVDGNANPAIAAYAQAVHTATASATSRNADLTSAIASGDQNTVLQTRAGIQSDLATALDAAQLALQSFYSSTPTGAPVQPSPSTGAFPATVVSAAQAVATAIAADSNYCSTVSQPGSAVNSAVHVFKTAWNASQTPTVPINTGNYEQATSDALRRVLGAAPAACAARVPPPVRPAPHMLPQILPQAQTQQQPGGLSGGAILGLALLGAGAVGGAIYYATGRKSRSRSSRRTPGPRRARKHPEFKYYPDGDADVYEDE